MRRQRLNLLLARLQARLQARLGLLQGRLQLLDLLRRGPQLLQLLRVRCHLGARAFVQRRGLVRQLLGGHSTRFGLITPLVELVFEPCRRRRLLRQRLLDALVSGLGDRVLGGHLDTQRDRLVLQPLLCLLLEPGSSVGQQAVEVLDQLALLSFHPRLR